MVVDLGKPYRLSSRVALRPEPFGALAYHFGNRRLSFLKAPRLVDLVRSLDAHESLRDALYACGIGSREEAGFVKALDSLLAADLVIERSPEAVAREPQ
jgi:putative mycofactocin binding protein MftB